MSQFQRSLAASTDSETSDSPAPSAGAESPRPAVENYPTNTTTAAGGLDAAALGPQSPAEQRTISDTLAGIEQVSQVFPVQTNSDHNGPVEFLLYTGGEQATATAAGDNRTSPTPTLQQTVHDAVPAVYAVDMCSTPRSRPRDRAAAPASPDWSVTVWQHPLTPAVGIVAESLHITRATDVAWTPPTESLPSQQQRSGWEAIDPLWVGIDAEAEIDPQTVADALARRVVPELPRETHIVIEQHQVDELPVDAPQRVFVSPNDSTQAVLEITVAPRENQNQTASGVYRADATTLSRLLESDTQIAEATADANDEQSASLTSYSQADTDTGDTVTTASTPTIDLTVTSPVYLDAIDYTTSAASTDDDYTGEYGGGSRTETTAALTAWKQTHRDIFQDVFDQTNDGGYCAIVVGHVKGKDKAEFVDLGGHLATVMRDIGWTLHEKIVWQKIGADGNRFGTTIQNPKPSYYYPGQTHETIQVWRKGSEIKHPKTTEEFVQSELLLKELKTNVWTVPPVPHNASDHPCPFPAELVYRLTCLYSTPGDIVYDPFTGSGTTPFVADRLGRVGIGTEREPTFAAAARSRLATSQFDRSQQHIPEFSAVDGDAAALRAEDTTHVSGESDAPTGQSPPATDATDASDTTRRDSNSDDHTEASDQAGLAEFD